MRSTPIRSARPSRRPGRSASRAATSTPQAVCKAVWKNDKAHYTLSDGETPAGVNALCLSGSVNTEVQEIMKPRVDITALSMTADYETVKRTIIESGFSRIPVYEEDVDNIRGTLYVKDLLPYINNGGDFAWQQLIRKPYFVPEHKKINDLLADFQSNKVHMAIVVDEYGSTLGLVSLEDIIEEIVGEISDESDNDECFYTRLDAKSYIFEGKTHLGDFERILDIGEDVFADVRGEAETLAGLMLELKRDFPRKGDVFTSHDLRFTVQEMDGHRVDKIRVDLQ